MVDESHSTPPSTPTALIVHNRISLIWIIPIIAAIAVAWLAWQNLSNNGPTIKITFETAVGLEAGKTKIKHNNADLGIVEKIEPTDDLSHVVVIARMKKLAEAHLTKGTKFWVVRPRLTAEGVSELGTIISGSYIELEPGKGDSAHEFTGDETPPSIPAHEPGTTYSLHADQLGSIGEGTTVYFRGIAVGQVLGYELSDKDGSATIQVFVHAPHDKLVHIGTRFWNASGIAVKADSEGMRIQLESIQSLLTGGIAFDVPPNIKEGDVANEKTAFMLYPDVASARESIFTHKIHFLLHFNYPIPGIVLGSQVRLQGVQVGKVTDIKLEYDANTNHINIPIVIELDADRFALLHVDNASKFEDNMNDAFGKLVSSGLRARLGSGNMLTGQKVINLDFVSNTAPATLITGAEFPEIPTVEADDIDSVVHSAKDLLTSLQATANTLNKAVGSPQMHQSMQSLTDSLNNLDHITHETSVRIGPLLQSLQDVSTSADNFIKQAGTSLAGGSSQGELGGALHELKDAARSIRVLADYLDKHPEALLRGKPKESDKP